MALAPSAIPGVWAAGGGGPQQPATSCRPPPPKRRPPRACAFALLAFAGPDRPAYRLLLLFLRVPASGPVAMTQRLQERAQAGGRDCSQSDHERHHMGDGGPP